MIIPDLMGRVAYVFNILIVFTIGLFVWELFRLRSAVHGQHRREQIEQHMVAEHVSERRAEEEVTGEERVRHQEQKAARLEMDEFLLLKELLQEVQQAASGTALLDATTSKLRALHHEETMEKKLTRRLSSLFRAARRIAQEEPQKRTRIEEILLEINSYNKKIITLMAKNGTFETTLRRSIEAGFTLENKRDALIAILRQAMQYDAALLGEVKRLNKVIASG